MKRLHSWLLFFAVLIAAIGASAQSATPTFSLLFSFPCDSNFVCPDGYFPVSLVEGIDGNFYGTAVGGGVGMNAQGTVFQFTPGSGQVTVLFSFAEQPDGSLPLGSSPETVIEGSDGFLYGTTLVNGKFGEGTVFKMTKNGAIQDLHDFCNTLTCSDGALPSFLMQALDGNFYGSTGPQNFPTSVLYRISSSGTYKVLHTFDTKTQPDGTGTYGFLQSSDGNFYGATTAGEQNKPFNSIFRFNPITSAYTILHGFNWPNVATGNLIQSSSGELFGVQANSILYEISKRGAYHMFGAMSPTQFWNSAILQASDGNLWGNFQAGCGFQGGVFTATTGGSLLQDLVYDCLTVGEQIGSMFQAADGKFYGITSGEGGVSTTNPVLNGTIWSLDAGLPPPAATIINFAPAQGAVGSKVLLQGTHFVGTTTVSFNGVNAAFQLLSGGYISATVPAGATTGTIAVTNAGGTTTSTKSFTVQ
ncbi:MAG TPA: choice-of-anchor tandem repeat GloVer-containing protein [Terriglobales bacterium]|nr:choice-of-anchor tandem repeat GloVer-containing protein [Terriglobales bacterium]